MGKLHVLVADDDPSLQFVIAETFRAAGYRVTTAADGDEALRALAAERLDACVLDIGMPGRNGFELCRDLRARGDDGRTLPIVLLTARNADTDRYWGLDAGADEYLTKPFDPAALITAVAELIESRLSGEERNPITKLPALGSVVRRARELGREGHLAAIALVELEPEAAKVHRQKYGDLKSAEALRTAATCLRQALASAVDRETLMPLPLALGHAGDVSYSRFALAGPPAAVDQALDKARTLFAQKAPELYAAVDRERGHVLARDRDGATRRIPLLALSVEIVPLSFLEGELRGAGNEGERLAA
jgi:DNA-binding response OmpR family regulator